MLHYLFGITPDPHYINAVVATCESSVKFWDLRIMMKANAYECAIIRNANYDVIKHILRAICDTHMESQKARIPVKEHPGHMHWTWAVTFNPEVPTQTHLLTCDRLLHMLVMNQPLEGGFISYM
ncbi:WD repeat-containing protein DWA2 [Gossypium arboreum]|uniref:WD repeat-containing protein DWA2 n=1 Tax=Gossypium arboreum TaxID=29729 RepID=UPI0022F1D716|nr:WD repeat-containing protein DWA2 [Gossypium arboreum]